MQSPLAALSLNPSKISVRAGSAETRERRRHDPFLSSISRQRKAANLSRQQELSKEREAALGDPVESKQTDFIEQLQVRMAPEQFQRRSDPYYNHSLRKVDDMDASLEYSGELASPVQNPDRHIADPQLEQEAMEEYNANHENARQAIYRIVDLQNGSMKDRLRVNFLACIGKFGRHNTDQQLNPKPAASKHPSLSGHLPKTPRVGCDTGSPEVQVAILTLKILNLSRHLQTANTDKHNKRNLRILVHKRQKMLKYLRRKERGGPRYQNVMEQLGLSDAAWKGEISM